KSGHPYNMMWGLDDSFDGVLYIGYHAPAGDPNFTLSHTSTGNSLYLRLNGSSMSEFLLNSYTAASLDVPVLFISGDERICTLAKDLVPGITTVVTKRGVGSSTFCVPVSTVRSSIHSGVVQALCGPFDTRKVILPQSFTYEVTFKDWKKAYQMSFYPGMKAVDAFTDRLISDTWLDVVTAHSFVVY
ncbi:MAG: M55 family metallopeptidase, partial [Sphaerochaetaceae bacterium]